jgi:hypothetical protein
MGYLLPSNGAVNTVFSVGSVPSSYKGTEKTRRRIRRITADYRTAVESSRVESSKLAAAEMARKELDCEKSSCMI